MRTHPAAAAGAGPGAPPPNLCPPGSPWASQTLAVPLVIAAVALGFAIHVHDGEYAPVAAALLTLGLISLTAALVLPRLNTFRRWRNAHANPGLASLALRVGLVIQLVALFASWPGVDLPHRGHFQLWPLHLGLLIAALLLFAGMSSQKFPHIFSRTIVPEDPVALACDSRWNSRWFPALLAVSLLLGIWMVHSSPDPHIDVWVFQQDAAAEFLKGHNPYAMTFPDIYHSTLPGHSAAYARSLVVNDRLQFGFIYPPLTLLFSTLAYAVVGDVRYAQVAAMVLAAAFIGYARPGQIAKLSAALLLFTPRIFFIYGRAWTEPFVILLLAITIFLACRPYRSRPDRSPGNISSPGASVPPPLTPERIGLSLGLLFVAKQYTILAAPLSFLLLQPGLLQPGLLRSRPRTTGPLAPAGRWRNWCRLLVPAFLVDAVVTLPFVLWNPRAFWRSIVTVQQLGPFRWDALTYLVWYGSHGHPWITRPLVAFLCSVCAVVFALALSLWRAPRTPAGFAAALALTALVFFAFNKQAFANYYFFVIGALCCAIAACGPAEDAAAILPDSAARNPVAS